MTNRGRSANTTESHEDTKSRRRKTVGDRAEAEVVADDRVVQERELLVHERQRAVEQVLDRHDTLIREAFHLEKFVSLLAYDPKVAKTDNSAVFQDFKSRFDLISQSTGAGPSRTTRRAHHDRLDALKASANTSATAPPALRDNRKPKKVPKPKADPSPTFWSIVEETKGKAKPGSPERHHNSVSAGPSRHGKGKAKVHNASLPDALPGFEEVHVGVTDISAGSIHPHKRLPAPPSHADPPQEASPRKKRKIAIIENDHPPDVAAGLDVLSATMAKSKPVPSLPKHPLSRPHKMRSSHSGISNVPESPTSTDLPPNTALSPAKPPLSIRRVKLIVRRPLPSFSHPRQRPPRPQHRESLGALLNSYVHYDTRELPTNPLPEEVEQNARSRAAFWNRVDRLRREGKLFYIPDSDDFDPSIQQGDDIRKDPDIWDYVVDEVVTNGKTKARFPSGAQIAGQIAIRVKAYWEGVSIKEDKMRLQEEQKKRVMARKLVRDVTAAWSRALAHIRQEARLAYEAEERRRGHEHLDDILKNAGRILEAQQVDLFRGGTSTPSTSRASSVSRDDLHDGDEEDQASDAATEKASDAEDDEFDTTALLGDVVALSREDTGTSVEELPQPSSTPMDVDRPSTVPSERLDQDVALPLSRSHSPARSSAHTPASFGDNNQDLHRQTSLSTPHHGGASPAVRDIRTESDGPDTIGVGLQEPVFVRDKNDLEVPMVADPGVFLPSPASEENPAPTKAAEDGEESNPIPNGHAVPVSEHEGPDRAVAHTPSGMADTTDVHDGLVDEDDEVDSSIPAYLRPFAVTPVDWDPQSKVKPPPLLRGTLRPYQHAGLEWLASIHGSNLNGILADEMGLGKTIQTIALLAHLACDRGIWGPHLIIVPTSVLLNWEMEFKKFLPGFKVLSYHGNTKRRKELRQGWNNKYHFNVCVTSYTLASRDAHVFKRKPWYYMILDEAHMIKNFKSQRWNILLMFRSFRRLLLTGTPLQNNLTELWALLQFLMSGTNFANLKEFGDWFSNPLEKAIELGTALDDENQQRVSKLHTVLRPYLLRRLKKDVEKELPSKFEHLVMCPLSKRQRYLYDEFMARAETRHDLQSGVYQKIANILMQLRKVVNHPDLFEVRPIRTSFAMQRSAIADYEIKELLVRRRLLQNDEERVNLGFRGFRFIDTVNTPLLVARESRRLDGTNNLPFTSDIPEEPPPYDVRTIDGYRRHRAYQQRAETLLRWEHIAYLNQVRCSSPVVLGEEVINIARRCNEPLLPLSALNMSRRYWTTATSIHAAIKPYSQRAADMASYIDTFAFATPPVVALDLPRIALRECESPLRAKALDPSFDAVLHRPSVKLQIAFPDASLLQYDCGKLQRLAELLRERKAGGHRILIFTQMTRILDILEIFLNLHGYLYLRLDGATKIEDRQYITERFNCDPRVFCFISSSRSGGVGINLTGADTVVFYDSDFNPQMDRQCEDRAHRIGQIRDVHIYRFISQHTVEEALLRKANQKRSLDDIVIQKGEFDWRSLVVQDEVALTKALGEFEDTEDAHAAVIAAKEAAETEGADEADFGWEGGTNNASEVAAPSHADYPQPVVEQTQASTQEVEDEEEEEEEGGSVADYMIAFIRSDMEFFGEWR